MYLLYALFYRCYIAYLRLGSLINPKARAFFAMRKECVQHYKLTSTWQSNNHKVLWMHCASVGEFEQGRPVLESFRTRHPTWKIVLTFYSPSGYFQYKNWDGVDLVLALPLDYRSQCIDFLERIKPDHILWIRYDFWPQIYSVISDRGIPLTLIGARIHKGHRLLSSHSVAKTMRQAITKFFTVDESSVSLLHDAGSSHAEYAGDPRFDRVVSIASNSIDKALDALRHGKEKILVAGSTWPKDQALLAQSINHLMSKGWKLIVVPHEVDEVSIEQCCRQFPKGRLWSEVGWSHSEPLLIVDAVGQLSNIYSVADLAYVGGVFELSGVHNILEPMVYDLPVMSGPNISRSIETLAANKKGFLRTLGQKDDFFSVLEASFNAKKEGVIASWVKGQTGATDRITH
ncbi:MAG: glycosyltransferase N-terminal domain-containing protein, partial [Bacteroidota bacterium]|nr:glycosyltransferase N-terminal domain-containing protein [Bacteroidota bacterium]